MLRLSSIVRKAAVPFPVVAWSLFDTICDDLPSVSNLAVDTRKAVKEAAFQKLPIAAKKSLVRKAITLSKEDKKALTKQQLAIVRAYKQAELVQKAKQAVSGVKVPVTTKAKTAKPVKKWKVTKVAKKKIVKTTAAKKKIVKKTAAKKKIVKKTAANKKIVKKTAAKKKIVKKTAATKKIVKKTAAKKKIVKTKVTKKKIVKVTPAKTTAATAPVATAKDAKADAIQAKIA